jgi:hypothetical protein
MNKLLPMKVPLFFQQVYYFLLTEGTVFPIDSNCAPAPRSESALRLWMIEQSELEQISKVNNMGKDKEVEPEALKAEVVESTETDTKIDEKNERKAISYIDIEEGEYV